MNFEESELISSEQFSDRFEKSGRRIDLLSIAGSSYERLFDNFTGKEVFIKLFNRKFLPKSARNDVSISSLRNLEHPSIIKFHNLVRIKRGHLGCEMFAVILEHFGGVPLRNVIPMLDNKAKAEVVVQMLEGVMYLHHQGFVHQDLKSSNFLIAPERNDRLSLKIIDIDFLDRIGKVPADAIGTYEYMAPEWASLQPLSASIDLWSIGCVIYEVFTNQLPFGVRPKYSEKDKILQAYVSRIDEHRIEDALSRFPNDSGFENIVKNCLTYSPSNRSINYAYLP